MRVFSDKIQSVKNLQEDYFEEIPVDMNGSFVPFDKWDKSNLDKMQKNIRHKFQMDQSWLDTVKEEVIEE